MNTAIDTAHATAYEIKVGDIVSVVVKMTSGKVRTYDLSVSEVTRNDSVDRASFAGTAFKRLRSGDMVPGKSFVAVDTWARGRHNVVVYGGRGCSRYDLESVRVAS